MKQSSFMKIQFSCSLVLYHFLYLIIFSCAKESSVATDPLIGRWDNYQFYPTYFTRTIYEFEDDGEFSIWMNDTKIQHGFWMNTSNNLLDSEQYYHWTYTRSDSISEESIRVVFSKQLLRAQIFFERNQSSSQMTIAKLN